MFGQVITNDSSVLRLVYDKNTYLSSCTNSSNLCSQVISLVSRKWWVAYDGTFQITGEKLLDLSTAYNLSGGNWWQLGPWLT